MSQDEAPDLHGVGMNERKAFLRVLTSLAWADGVVDEAELEVLHLAASDLRVSLGERDLEERDVASLAGKITHPALQERLLVELRKLAESDQALDPEELSRIKLLATAWGMKPPPIDGVDWSKIG